MSKALGMDVSQYQAVTPSLQSIDFLIARATYALTVDPMYSKHQSAARAAGIPFGAYHFGVGSAQASVLGQVSTFLSAVGDADWLVLDLEANGNGPRMTNDEASSFIRSIHSRDRRKILLYHSASGFPSLGQDGNWIAHWGIAPGAVPEPWTFHQYRGSPLDLDVFNGDAISLKQYLVTGGDPMNLAQYLPGYTVEVKKGMNIRSGELLTSPVLRVTAGTEKWTIIGTLKGSLDTDCNGTDWIVAWANGRWEYTSKCNLSVLPTAPVSAQPVDCQPAINAAVSAQKKLDDTALEVRVAAVRAEDAAQLQRAIAAQKALDQALADQQALRAVDADRTRIKSILGI